MNRAEELANEYADFLRSPRWHEIKLAIFERDRHICQACGRRPSKFNLTVHHLTYRFGFDAPFWVLQTVCKDPCHERLHARKLGFVDRWDPDLKEAYDCI